MKSLSQTSQGMFAKGTKCVICAEIVLPFQALHTHVQISTRPTHYISEVLVADDTRKIKPICMYIQKTVCEYLSNSYSKSESEYAMVEHTLCVAHESDESIGVQIIPTEGEACDAEAGAEGARVRAGNPPLLGDIGVVDVEASANSSRFLGFIVGVLGADTDTSHLRRSAHGQVATTPVPHQQDGEKLGETNARCSSWIPPMLNPDAATLEREATELSASL